MQLPSEQPPDASARLRPTDPQLHALEYLLNNMSRHGLQVQRLGAGQWQWTWDEQTGYADELGTAILAALHWYFGLTLAPAHTTAS